MIQTRRNGFDSDEKNGATGLALQNENGYTSQCLMAGPMTDDLRTIFIGAGQFSERKIMASLSTDANGNRRILFFGADGKRRPIRLGKMPKKDAERIKLKVEILAAAQITNHPVDVEISKWVAGIGDDLYDKLAAVKLLPQRSHATVNLHDFITLYIDGRTDIKQATRIGLLQAQTRLVDFFGKGIDLRQFTQADADRWVIHLRAKYAEATAARTIKRARQFFTAAKRAKKIQDNPFDGIKPGRMENPEKHYFLSAGDTAKILDQCPSPHWRAIVALCRWGGLRCPSEVVELTWADMLWDQNRFRVRSPKMEGTSKEERYVPMFPELRPHLEALFDSAEAGAIHLIRDRTIGPNWRTTLTKIIRRAGLTPWPRLMQNLRSSRETELVERFPVHVVAYWLGNSPNVATKHYLQVRDTDFEQAAQIQRTQHWNVGGERGLQGQ